MFLWLKCFPRTIYRCDKKIVAIRNGDIILLSVRDFQELRADVIHKYTPNAAKNLMIAGEIPKSVFLYIKGNAVEERNSQAFSNVKLSKLI